MTDRNDLLDHAVDLFPAPEGSVAQVHRDVERRQRNRRIRAGAVGVIVALAMVAGLVRSIESEHVPADRLIPPPVASGALAYALGGDIYVADPDGSNAVKISDGIPDARCEMPSYETYLSWSPDGKYLAFQRDCPSSELDDMVIIDPHGNAIAEFPTYGGGWGFTWSPDSTRVAVWERGFVTIGVYGVDGERQASLPQPPVTGGGNSAGPGWMPDGSALLLFGYAVIPLDGSPWYELSLGGQATYSPDGTRIAVDTGNSITVLDAEGSLVSEVDGRMDGVDGWSQDGEHFASLSHGELTVVDASSGTVTVLSEATAVLDGRDEILGVRGFSPQGDRILYATGDGAGGGMALYSIGVDGSGARPVVAGTTQGEWRSR